MNKLNKIATAIALLGSAAAPMAVAQTSMLPTTNYNSSWYFAPSINAYNPDDRLRLTYRSDRTLRDALKTVRASIP